MRNLFGSAKNELMPGAENAVDTCLAVRAGECVALIADEVSKPVAASLAAALDQRGAKYDAFLLEDFGPVPCAKLHQKFYKRWKPPTWESCA